MANTGLDEFWEKLTEHEGKIFYTVKGLEFRYRIAGGELFVDRKAKSITKATVGKALDKVHSMPDKVTGPKSLGMFGAPYIWALFLALGVVEKKNPDPSAGKGKK